MLSDQELDQVAPFVAQMIEDRLRERLGWIVAASGLNVGETDGAQDGELRASGAVRTRAGISMGGAELSAPAGVLAGIQIAATVVSPASGARFLYPKSDGWYEKNSAGVESKLITSAHTHDDRYYTEGELNTSGAGGQVHWNNLTNKPSGALYYPISPRQAIYTNAAWNIGTYDITAWGNYGVPNGAKAICVFGSCTWGAANNGYTMQICNWQDLANGNFGARAQVANIANDFNGIVQLDNAGRFTLSVGGANASNGYLIVSGYFQ